MNKRSLCLLLFIAFLLGCFFQYSRFDGFLHLDALGNRTLAARVLRPMPPEGAEIAREKFLIDGEAYDVIMATRLPSDPWPED